ncbi:consortin, connexin sorting protein b [Thunnus albacares]|uniref:consortin, connexin sorting protein b n=1 Tax=Thunnus maccoyii TaxID=8240 RepID=UPI001C4CE784|nr:consortin, connexin sorting protein b [Thunnus maccoyii]XP_042247340.1 consortin, connexin sorting protein b [Thunnus maccoyii]XP_042247341.1 consortin, connexin sorting protein b [Thunnus maccoyii]XP_042247342.1 consortin, connexin sorting protein b [Thunnus maccoyii]XP_044185499.1 consortin, connexin sorting protein b [Thunnus albacares]XP_044185500.1 consortin, connexin sorting protein b [Thunnus albacares]
MGNKNSNPPKGLDTATPQKEEGVFINSVTGSVSRDGPPGPSTELLASLQSLGENSDYTLLPHSLHQIAVAYSVKEDYQWAIQFLQLEKLYHERLLSNLAGLQENWESQWRERNAESSLPADTDISQKHIETLSQICRTHLGPSISVEQNTLNTTQEDIQSKKETPESCHETVTKPETTHQDEEEEQSMSSESELSLPQTGHQQEDEEEDGEEEQAYEEGQEVEEEAEPCEETPEEEVKVEWPTGVPQASDKDLAKLSHSEGSSCPDGLVSILKRRRASLDGLPPPSDIAKKQSSKRKVRFSEPDDGIEQDEVGGDSCLILLLLCLVTVVISIGGTAFYCTLVDTYSNICTDFTHNVDFYVMNVRRFFEGLGHWLHLRT